MLKGKNIFLRPLERVDLDRRVDWVNDEEIRQNLMFEWPLSLAKTHKWFDNQLFDDTKANFSIVESKSKEVIGMTGLLDISIRHSRAQFYMTIGNKDFWGKRIPDENIPLVLEYAFEELGLNKVYLYTININEKARHVYLRNGFESEGTLREHYFCVGKLQDLHVFSFLRRNWKMENND